MAQEHITNDNPPLSLPIIKSVEPLLQALPSVTEVIESYIAASLSPNSRRAYQSDLSDFIAWGACFPSSPEMLAAYLSCKAPILSPHTLNRRIVAISRAHVAKGLADPTKNDLIRTVMRGVRRSHGKQQIQAIPLLKEDLLNILPLMSGTKGIRDRAILLLGFCAALRRSELVAVNVEDIEFHSEGLVLNLRRSKTDQTGIGRKIAIPYGRGSECAVKALSFWLTHSQICEGAVLRSVSKAGCINQARLSAQSISLILKKYADLLGMSTHLISGHSLRSGFATSAVCAGAAVHKIQAQTGHKSLSMLMRYVRDASLFKENACGTIF